MVRVRPYLVLTAEVPPIDRVGSTAGLTEKAQPDDWTTRHPDYRGRHRVHGIVLRCKRPQRRPYTPLFQTRSPWAWPSSNEGACRQMAGIDFALHGHG